MSDYSSIDRRPERRHYVVAYNGKDLAHVYKATVGNLTKLLEAKYIVRGDIYSSFGAANRELIRRIVQDMQTLKRRYDTAKGARIDLCPEE